MRSSRRLFAPALAAALGCAGALSLASVPAARADSIGSLPGLSGFHQVVADDADGYVFLSGGIGSRYLLTSTSVPSSIVVTSMDGQYVTTLDAGAGVEGIAAGGGTLYAALAGQGKVAAIDIATITAPQPAQAYYPLGTGDVPYGLALQSGKLWVSYYDSLSPSAPHAAIGDIDLSTGTFNPASTGTFNWTLAPDITADPADTGVLLAIGADSTNLAATYTTTTDPVTQLAGPAVLGSPGIPLCTNPVQAAITPGGSTFRVACTGGFSLQTYSTADLGNQLSSRPLPAYPNAIAIAGDGTMAAEYHGTPQGIDVYQPDGTSVNSFDLSDASFVPADGLAWSADKSRLFAVTSDGGSYSLRVLDAPTVTRSALTLTGPAKALFGNGLAITGKLTVSAGSLPAGTVVSISRKNPDGSVSQLTEAQTDDGGSFTVADTPPTTGAYTYSASYAGGPAGARSVAPAQASSTVTVSLNTAALTLAGPSAAVPGAKVTLNGTLQLGTGSPPASTVVAITRGNPDGTTTPLAAALTAADGSFTVADTPPGTGSYTYTAAFAGDARTATAKASAVVSIQLSKATISLSGASSVPPVRNVAITGTLTLSPGSPATGTAISVTRANPNKTTTALKAVTTGSGGRFTITDKPPATGAYTYTASYPGTQTTTAAKATFTVRFAKLTPALTLAASAGSVAYASTITVTAHLGSPYSNHTVSVYYQVAGTSAKRLLKTGSVNSSGNLTVSYPAAARNVAFTVTFSGDAAYNARSVSGVHVAVRARVSTSVSGYYTSTTIGPATYRVFHHTSDADYKITVTPNKHGQCVQLVVQQWFMGGWNYSSNYGCDSLGSASTLQVFLDLSKATGGQYRAQIVYVPSKSDPTNAGSSSSWFYFTVVK